MGSCRDMNASSSFSFKELEVTGERHFVVCGSTRASTRVARISKHNTPVLSCINMGHVHTGKSGNITILASQNNITAENVRHIREHMIFVLVLNFKTANDLAVKGKKILNQLSMRLLSTAF